MTSINGKVKKLSIILILCLILLPNFSIAIVEPTNEFYANDYANVLDDSLEERIVNVNKTLQDLTESQIVVVTIPNLEGKSLEDYSTEIFEKFEIGDKKKDNGILILFVLEENQIKLKVGNGLKKFFSNEKIEEIQEKMVKYFNEDNINRGIEEGVSEFLSVLEDVYKLNEKKINIPYQFLLAILFFIFVFIAISTYQNNRSSKELISKYVVLTILFVAFSSLFADFKFYELNAVLTIVYGVVTIKLKKGLKMDYSKGEKKTNEEIIETSDEEMEEIAKMIAKSDFTSGNINIENKSIGKFTGGGGVSGGGGSSRKIK